jgi:hypothetical protein
MRVAGFDIQALVSGDQAQCFEAYYTSATNGTGPAPHCHPWDETFSTLWRLTLSPGSLHHLLTPRHGHRRSD